jgi:hypothetical protein
LWGEIFYKIIFAESLDIINYLLLILKGVSLNIPVKKKSDVKQQFIDCLEQGRPTQLGLWAADQLFSHILGRNL